MKQELRYNGDFNNIVSISNLQKQVYINALCFTKTIEEAALEVGIASRTMHSFVKQEQIDNKKLQMMRLEFKISGKKIKKRFDYD